MSESQETGDEPQQGGVFGNLPNERPGVRSPRRQSGEEPGGRKRQASSNARPGPARHQRAPRTAAPRERRPPPPPQAAPATEGPGPERGGRGVEDVAWAGITVAAEAATLGVRLLGRAVEAVRKAPGRR
jgi:hypothetical protein